MRSAILFIFGLLGTNPLLAALANPTIVAMDYSNLAALVERGTGQKNILLEEVRTASSRACLIVKYRIVGMTNLPNRETAFIKTSNVEVFHSMTSVEFDNHCQLLAKSDGERWLFTNGQYLAKSDYSRILAGYGASYLLLSGSSSAIVALSNVTHALVNITNGVQARHLFSGDGLSYVIGERRRNGEMQLNVAVYSFTNGSWTLRTETDLPGMGRFFDFDPRRRRLLVADNKTMLPSCYEWDLDTGRKRRLGWSHEYVWYLSRECASMLKRYGALTLTSGDE